MRIGKCRGRAPARGAALVLAALALALVGAAPADVGALRLDWMDLQSSPAVDFYRYANGGWQEKNPVPPARARWGTFDVMREHTQQIVRGILERTAAEAASAPAGSVEQKIGDFYATGMDEAAIEQAGVTPLRGELERIAGAGQYETRESILAHLQMIGVGAGFDFGSMADYTDSDRTIGVAIQGGLGLPDRAYYLVAGFASVRAEYAAHIARTLSLLGDPPAEVGKEAVAILNLETRLAKASLSRAALRDPHATYHVMDRAALARLTPGFSWPTFFAAIGRPDIESIDVATPTYFEAFDAELAALPIEELQAYLRWHLGSTYAPYLSRAFQEEAFRMHAVLTGVTEMLPRWQRVQNAADEVLGFAVGKKYVEEVFPPEAKERAQALLNAIRAALADDLATLSWMSPPTRDAALVKLGAMKERIGYPDRWRDYSGYVVDRGPFVLNVLRGKAFEMSREIAKIDRPTDREEWLMTPQTVNAYYDPSMNDINFPAAILQPPFFDPAASAALNHGAIGWIMGHEMTHGFDDEGAQFDERGNLRNWWTPEDLARFHALTACISEQFSGYTAGGVHLEGALVTGEATADLGGLMLAYRAFHARPNAAVEQTISGFTPEQQFFLAAAHVWASNTRPEEERLLATTDPHPPPRYRVNGTVANMPAFQAAFQIPDDSPMVRATRCRIW